ncbi:AVF-2 beta chain like [Actinidia chinensis var. chinensis]|uniref:AVF-2 beta chain like n=1 Tax=Actinidia chinensis var. chinensis TaxID=1590841 RepID=A0A2R6QAT7_ACTCC|nr:AVF-2 beta chain like [Actinidia chinensis var. chinensis]
MAPLSSFLFLLVLVYGIIASQNGFMNLNNVAEARALDVVPYGEVVKASSDRLNRFEPRKTVPLRKIPKPATPPPIAHKAVHMLDPTRKPKRGSKLVPPAAPDLPPPPPPLPPSPYRS